MLILAFDTTSEHGGAAVYRDLDGLGVAANQGAANYSATLFEMVERLLAQTKLSLRDIELFAVATGPGSFTGIRVGVAAAQGWATAFGRPVCGVSVLEALLEEAQPEADSVVPLLDARRGEIYAQRFRRVGPSAPLERSSIRDGAAAYDQRDPRALEERRYRSRGDFAAIGPGVVLKASGLATYLNELAQTCPGAPLMCLAREEERALEQLRQILPPSLKWHTVNGVVVHAIARLALRAEHEGKLQSPAELDAYYIRRSDAELHWRE